MDDRATYIEAGVSHSWAALMKDGQLIREFSELGEVTKLSEVDWSQVDEIWATRIEEIEISSPVARIKIPDLPNVEPVWFHRSVVLLGVSTGVQEAQPIVDFVGYTCDTHTTYCSITNDGCVNIVTEEINSD